MSWKFNVAGLLCLLLFSTSGCSDRTKAIADRLNYDSDDRMKLQQYYLQGLVLYKDKCANCHQQDGTGLARLIPPLAQSDFLRESFDSTICIIKLGHKGKIIVNGKDYNQPMPANPKLTNIEIAEIATYINNEWGNERGLVKIQEVEKAISRCESQKSKVKMQ